MRNKIKIIIIVGVSLVWLALLPGLCLGAEYYLDAVNGNDSYDGLAPVWNGTHGPWKTVDKAKSTVSSGDICNLLPGNYGSVTFGVSGDKYGTNWSAPVIYQNDPNSTSYSAKFSRILFSGEHDFYIRISGFDVKNTGSNDSCIKTENASYVEIIDCKAHGDSGGNGPSYANIYITTSDNVLIEDCEIYYGGAWGWGIQLEGSDTVTIRGCHVHDIVSSGIRTGGGQNYVLEYNIVHDQRSEWNPSAHGSGMSLHSINTILRGNIIYNFGNTRPIRFYQAYAGDNGYSNILVENNLVYKTADFTGTQWWPEFVDMGDNCIFRNNTFIGTTRIMLAKNADGSGLSLYNNIVTGNLILDNWGTYYPEPAPTLLKQQSCSEARAKWDNVAEGNNFFGGLYATGGGYLCSYDKFSNTSNSIVGTSFDIGVFFDSGYSHYPYTAGYPYELYGISPAIGFGNPLNAPTTDLLVNPRDAAPDAGAYEYISSTPPPILYGDVNGNGEVTSYDAALAARYAVGLEVFTDEQRQKADVSGNSEITAYDAALIAQKAVGLIDRFPVEE